MFAQLPLTIIQDVVNAILNGLGLGGLAGPINDLLGGLQQAFTDFINALTDPFNTNPSGSSPADPLAFLGNAFQDLLNSLGLGLGGLGGGSGGGGLGTGTQTTTGDTSGSGGGTVTGVTTLVTDPAINQLLTSLIGAGAMTSGTPVPAHTLQALTPGAAANVQPDSEFASAASLLGHSEWIWDWPGSEGGTWGDAGCIRTLRRAPVTIYWCDGTWELTPGLSQAAGPNLGDPRVRLTQQTSNITVNTDGQVPGDTSLLNWSKAEFYVVPYEAAVYPMGESLAQGTANLVKAIRSRPGPFILMGHSQGGAVISGALDELRHGVLQDRYNDLLFGCAVGNMRRQVNTPAFGTGTTNYAGTGFGCVTPTLKDTPTDKWWEISFQAGTYPANDSLTGVTYAPGDEISSLPASDRPLDPNDITLLSAPASPYTIRSMLKFSIDAKSFNALDFVGGMAKMLLSPTGQEIQAVLSATSAHNTACWEVQPNLADGDHRTCWQIIWDHINTILDGYPDTVGVRKQIEGVQFPVQPLEVVSVSGKVEWTNAPATTGDQIQLGINCYDASGNFIAFIGGSDVTPGATIIAPVGDSAGWNTLSADFVTPEGSATAAIALVISPDIMTTGTVWFDAGMLEPTGFLDASLLKNIEAIPSLPHSSVQGAQGQADMLTSYQNLLDSLGSAASQQNLTGVQLSQVATMLSQTAQDAQAALALATSLATSYQGPVGDSWLTSGTYTFTLPSWIASGDLVDIIALGAGAGSEGSQPIFDSQGGMPGTWVATTKVFGTDISGSATALNITVGVGGVAGAAGGFGTAGGPGGNGGASSVSATGMADVMAAGGQGGGQSGNSRDVTGGGPGTMIFNGAPYFGGHDVVAGQSGSIPGGGAGGVRAFSFDASGPGSDGYVLVRVRKP
jgi:hypothetical protein